MLRGALVGFGEIAEKAHLPAFLGRPDFKIVAVAEAQPRRRDRAQELLGGARVYADFDTLIEREELDFIDLATPPFLHADQAARALAAGRHVLCEKPLALDHAQRSRLDLARAASSRVLWTVHNWAYAPQWRKILELAAGVAPLRRVSLEVRRQRPSESALSDDWRRNAKKSLGGILVDHGWHQLYLVFRLLGEGPVSIVSELDCPKGEVEESARVRLEYREAIAQLDLTWRASDRANRGVIEGRGGVVEILDNEVVLSPVSGAPTRFSFAEKLSAGSAHPEWFGAMLDDFRAALEGDTRLARANTAEAHFCADIITRAYE